MESTVTRKYNASGAVAPSREIASYENLFEEVVRRGRGKLPVAQRRLPALLEKVDGGKGGVRTRGKTETGKGRANNIAPASLFTRRELLKQSIGWFVTTATPLTSN